MSIGTSMAETQKNMSTPHVLSRGTDLGEKECLPVAAAGPGVFPWSIQCAALSMERFEFVRLDGSLVLVEVRERILCTVMVGIVVGIDGLSFQARDSVEFFDRRRSQPRERAEHSTLDFGDLRIFHGINKSVLRFRGVVLKLLRRVFFSERSDLVEVHFEVVRHFFGEVILWGSCGTRQRHSDEGGNRESRKCHLGYLWLSDKCEQCLLSPQAGLE